MDGSGAGDDAAGRSGSAGRRRAIPFLAAVSVFLIATALYLLAPYAIYHQFIYAWGIQSWTFPFLDTDTVLSAVRCMRAGQDVYEVNFCDPLWRLFDYSPLWMTLAVLPITPGWTPVLGFLTDCVYFGALLLLPVGRGRREAWLIALAAIGSANVYAVERGNNDLIIFGLVAGAATLAAHGGGRRFAGYGCALLAGFLKYYPMLVMAMALRERPKAFLTVTLVSLAALGLFVGIAHADLVRALRLIPGGGYDLFGSLTFTGELATLFDWSNRLRRLLLALMVLAAVLIGMRIGAGDTMRDDLAPLDRRERTFLLAGALVVIGCFFTAQNIGYRAVQITLSVPTLTALWRSSGRRGIYGRTLGIAIALLWSEAWRQGPERLAHALLPDQWERIAFLLWFLREMMWWWLITAFIAFATGLLLRSEMAQAVLRRLVPAA